jgi:ubiquinone/menaquinone biosynthesis C-methylase UbiE
MPDVYSTITTLDPSVVAQVADAMEVSAADPQHRYMVAAYVADLALADDARMLEVGCRTGAIARQIARSPGVGEVLGVDPSPILLDRARELSEGIVNLAFQEGDGRRLPLPDAGFDAVVLHRVLSHVGPESVLAEAFRVLRPGGWLAVFDGDYATITLSTGAADPLESCVAAFRRPTSPTRGWSDASPPSSTMPASSTGACAATATSKWTIPTTCSRSPTAAPTRSPRSAASAPGSPPR